jgi:hypothetical protein
MILRACEYLKKSSIKPRASNSSKRIDFRNPSGLISFFFGMRHLSMTFRSQRVGAQPVRVPAFGS